MRVPKNPVCDEDDISPGSEAEQTSNAPESTPLNVALALAEAGHKVFPCGRDKKPKTTHGFKDASNDSEQIQHWWTDSPDALIGMPTGTENNMSVVDLDNDLEKGKDGLAEWEKLQSKYGTAPETFTTRTPRGGRHLYFQHRNGFRCSTDKLATGIDSRGEGGYVIFPSPGSGYTIEKYIPFAELPDWIYSAVVKPPGKPSQARQAQGKCTSGSKQSSSNAEQASADEADIRDAIEAIDPGCDYKTWLETGQAAHSWDYERGFCIWDDWSRKSKKYDGSTRMHWDTFKADGGITIKTLFHHAKEAGWHPKRDNRIAASVGAGDPISAAKAGDPWPMTDAGNAERFAHHMRDKLVFDLRKECWRRYDGTRWKEDKKGHVYRAAILVVRSIRFKEAEVAPAPKSDKNADLGALLYKHSLASESRKRLEAMVALARHMPGMARTEFDADPYLLNCSNGTLELRTGLLREHQREDYITRMSPVAYDPEADCTDWLNFLEVVLQGNQELARFLQKSVGLSLSGDISEEVLNLIHGPEATGKTTFLEGVKSTMGDYAHTCNFETFLKQKDSGRPRNDLAALDGARFVASSEVEDGKQLAENVIKTLTGGDKVSARFLFKEFFDFLPQFKLWLVCNHAPKVDAQDGAMWRRILRIPFTFTIPKEQRDKGLKRRLKDPAIGGIQILRWAVEGFLLWQAEGLQVPDIVVASTEEYRQSCDFLSDFFKEECDLTNPASWAPTALIFKAYTGYCADNGIKRVMSKISFSKQLEGRGFMKLKKGGIRGWQGICPASK